MTEAKLKEEVGKITRKSASAIAYNGVEALAKAEVPIEYYGVVINGKPFTITNIDAEIIASVLFNTVTGEQFLKTIKATHIRDEYYDLF